MSVYKRGKYYWYHFYWKGEHIQRPTGQTSKRVAEQMEAARRTQLAKGEVGIHEPKPAPLFSVFATDFRTKMALEHEAKPKTVAYYNYGLDRLLEYAPLRNARLDKKDDQMVTAYIAKRKTDTRRSFRRAKGGEKKPCKDTGKPIKVATISRELQVLRHLLRVARQWKLVSSIPEIRCLAGETSRDRVVTHAEEEAYLNVAAQPLRDVATIMLDTGMRPEEVFRIRWGYVHFQPAGAGAHFGYIHNPSGKTKNARRNIPITGRVQALLEMRHARQPNRLLAGYFLVIRPAAT